MFIRGYLRASTEDQDATRARDALDDFASSRGYQVAAWYVETASGATRERPELERLLRDARAGDVILVEAIDRLSRLPEGAWRPLRGEIESKGLRIVSVDLPTSHQALAPASHDEFTSRMLDAVNSMMLDMLAAIARKDYEQRRQRQRDGIERAKARGAYQGRPRDTAKHERIQELLDAGFSIRRTAQHANVSPTTVQQVRKLQQSESEGV